MRARMMFMGFSGNPKFSVWGWGLGLCLRRSFINARVKWVRDPYLDNVVQREKNLLPCLSLLHLLLSSSSLVPISSIDKRKPLSFFLRYPSLFHIYRTPAPHLKLTSPSLTLLNEELQIHNSTPHRVSAAHRLLNFLMLTRASKLPISIIDDFKFDLGLPPNYLRDLVPYFPDYFKLCTFHHENPGLGLELVCWRNQFATPALLRDDSAHTTHKGIVKFPMCFPPGFDLQKRVNDWVEDWQCLPYISPYEDAFHLAPTTDQAEKWTVAVLHEILSLLISKKTQVKNVLRLGDYLGFGLRFKQALAHHPGIFYVSNKITTQTVVLRQAFRKDFLIDKHPLMGMRHRYIYLMNKSRKRNKWVKSSTRHNSHPVGIVNTSLDERQ